MVYEATGSSGTVYRYGATLFASDDGTATYTYLLNGHGDVVQMLVGTTVVKSYKYDAFGNEIGINMADTNPFRYCAQYYDKESGTIYLRARYYAPGQGRFTQQDSWAYADPNNPSSLNLYIYCWNDPIQYYDPSGHSGLGLALLIGAVMLLTSCGRTTYSSTAEEANAAIMSYMLIEQEFETMDDAATKAAAFLFNDNEWHDNILIYEYQVNILWNAKTKKYYVTQAYTSSNWEYVDFQDIRPNEDFEIVATLHTHSQIKDDLESVFSKDKNNLPQYKKYVLETDGTRGRLVYYNRAKNQTESKEIWGAWDN